MSLLSKLLGARTAPGPEGDSGLEQGRIWVYTPAGRDSELYCDFCWQAPSSGEAVIEIWGAGGSGARGRCCGTSLPGNAGAYSKKTICVSEGSFIEGKVGLSCGNQGTSCFRGCSQSTCICWTGRDDDGCMCAEGGIGGITICSTGTEPFCCLIARFDDDSSRNTGCFCHTVYTMPCGVVCNWTGKPGAKGRAYGGDINRCGGISCRTILHSSPNDHCCSQYHVAVPPGIFSEEGVVITYQGEGNVAHGCYQGSGMHAALHGLAVAGKNPVRGGLYVSGCWSGANRLCSCYGENTTLPWMPYGVGGIAPQQRPSRQDRGSRGGHGAVRIKFIGTN